VAKKKVGRPSSYKPSLNNIIKVMCELGATDKDIARATGKSLATINTWKLKHPEFLDTLKAGKEIADTNVEKALYSRAIGYSHKEDKIFNNNGEALIVPTIKHYPPDATSCIFWLKNRKKEQWREKPEDSQGGNDELAAAFKKILDAVPN